MREWMRPMLLAVAIGNCLAACSTKMDVPTGAQLSCQAGSDCPSGLVCHNARCVNPAAMDSTPPDLAAPIRVSPELARAGTTVTIEVTPSEPLSAPPEVRLELIPLAIAPCVASGGSYRCSYTAAGDENGGLGGVVPFDVRMVDLAGNETMRKLAGAVDLDFKGPALAAGSVAYYPDPSNPLPSVKRATGGTQVRVALSADELLAPASLPVLTVDLAGTPLAFQLEPGSITSTGAAFRAVMPAGTPDGSYTPTVTWSDLAGNTASTSRGMPAIGVKTSAPALGVNQGAVVFVRSPWGNAVPEPLGGHTIPAGPYFALEPADPLSPSSRIPAGTFLLTGGAMPERILVQLGPDPGSLVLGTLLPDAAGTWPRQSLASPDAPTVYVVGVDDAGNESPAVKVENGEWVATSNPPWAGASPHALTATPYTSATRVQRTEVSGAVELDVAGADGRAALAVAQEAWRKVGGSVDSPGLERTAAAYDSARGRTVIFGGNSYPPPGRLVQDTWEWDGTSWLNVTPAGAKPSARQFHALAYDSARGRVVLFGGSPGPSSYPQDTWEWDGTSWREVTPAGAKPSGRTSTAMAYDCARGRVVLFGGSGSSGSLGDTWEWDGTSWTSITPASGSPAPGSPYGMAYDAARGRVVLVVGSTVAGSVSDTWEWDGSSWTSVNTAGAQPSFGAMAYQTARKRTLQFDGLNAWEWDGTMWTSVWTWTSVPPADPRPPTRAFVLAYDGGRRRVVFYGAPGRKETWEWDGAAWKSVTPTGAVPGARSSAGLAYDSTRRRTVLFGGTGAGQDTWEWDGSDWTSVTPAGASPTPASTGFAYDPVRRRSVLLGGGVSPDTWEWDGTSWTLVTPTGARPSTFGPNGLMAYDGARRRMVLAMVDTWVWDGASWTTITPAGAMPPPGQVAFDDARGRLVLYYGNNTSKTWEYDGSAWTDVTPVPSPPMHKFPSVAFDSIRGRTVLFGGMSSGPTSSVTNDTWEWDGTAWRETSPAGTRPPARRSTSLAFDSARGRTILFGGLDSVNQSMADTWELDASPACSPALQFDAAASTAGIDFSGVTGLRVRAYAGGTFSPGLPASVGATLLGWTSHSALLGPGAWIELAANSSGVAAQQPYLATPSSTVIDWKAPSAAEARRFVTARDGQLSFQVRPSGTMGPDPGGAKVALDYIEVRLRYRAP
jgi:hypothetical protein